MNSMEIIDDQGHRKKGCTEIKCGWSASFIVHTVKDGC
jgi:hypothetical protein